METTRRGFFGTVAAVVAGAYVRPTLPLPGPPDPIGLAALVRSLPPGHAVMGISTATFPFWRSQVQPSTTPLSPEVMRHMFENCDDA